MNLHGVSQMNLHKQVILPGVLAAASVLSASNSLIAAPLLSGTLTIEPDYIQELYQECTTGSCFGMELSPGLVLWTPIYPGNDGGFIVGKNQLSGGQEFSQSFPNSTPGDITAAWFFFGNYGTFYADNALNNFSDTSNDGTTAINDFNVAWIGNSIPMGGGTVTDYTIAFDGVNVGSYSLDYYAIVPPGDPSGFGGVNFRMIVRGDVINECYCPLVVNDVSISGECGTPINWIPNYDGYSCSCYTNSVPDINTCWIESNATNGNATVEADCSSGSYISGDGFEGTDSFTYGVSSAFGDSAIASVNVSVTCQVEPICQDIYPLRQVQTEGGGQSPTVNSTLTTLFTGHIITDAGLTSGGKNAVKVCPGTTVDFETTSTAGSGRCNINSSATASTGTLAAGDKLICSNKPDGNDTDRFTIKSEANW